jgi:hypothetical protein
MPKPKPEQTQTQKPRRRRAPAGGSEPPAPDPPPAAALAPDPLRLFGPVFADYWRTLQGQQAAVQARTAEAYQAFQRELQEIWGEDGTSARFVASCRELARGLGRTAAEGDDAEADEAYRAYVAALQDGWSQPELAERIEQAYEGFTDAVQKASEGSQEVLDQAKRHFLGELTRACRAVDAEAIDPETLSRVSVSLMTTVFFTEGMRPPE